jgi:hypothetical protein
LFLIDLPVVILPVVPLPYPIKIIYTKIPCTSAPR